MAIMLTSVLANERPSEVVRKIPNRKLFAAQLTMHDSTVASYGLDGRLSKCVFTQALLPHEVGQSSALREMGAIHKTLLCQGKTLKMQVSTTLWLLTDNSAVSIIFRKGSPRFDLDAPGSSNPGVGTRVEFGFAARLGFTRGSKVSKSRCSFQACEFG
jgi:hypothetical protein